MGGTGPDSAFARVPFVVPIALVSAYGVWLGARPALLLNSVFMIATGAFGDLHGLFAAPAHDALAALVFAHIHGFAAARTGDSNRHDEALTLMIMRINCSFRTRLR